MYSENNRRVSGMRANDEFLRRMLGGDLTGGETPVMNMEFENRREMLESNGEDRQEARTRENSKLRFSDEGNGSIGDGRPSCDGSVDNAVSGCKPSDCAKGECPTYLHAPSLAMVYSPRQCWRNLLDPQSALDHGTLFAELVLPFERASKRMGTEGNCRKC